MFVLYGPIRRRGLYVSVELPGELGGYRAVDGAGGHPTGVSERLHANPDIAVDRLCLHGALRRDHIHVAAHGEDHQRATCSRDVHVAHHCVGTEPRCAWQPHGEVHGDIVMTRPSKLHVMLTRAAAAIAAPHRADSNAALV